MTYLRPSTVEEALSGLAARDARIAAGCTDLFPQTQGQSLPWPVVDITGIGELRSITRTGDGWRFGATATWRDILRADLPPAFDGLKLAAREVGSAQIQGAGTIAGNLCNASPAADGVPPLLTLDAAVEIATAGGRRVVPLSAFITGPRRTALRAGEFVTAVLIPESAGRGASTFLKLGARKHLVISIAMVAARLELEGGRISSATLAVGSCSPVAQRLPDLEATLAGATPADAPGLVSTDLVRGQLTPIDDIRADSTYRMDAACELLRRALRRLAEGDRP